MLAASASDFLRAHCGFDAVRSWIGSDLGYSPALWKQMAGLGWMGVALPERYGGAGLGATALVSLVEPMGRALLGSPFLATSLASRLLLALGDDAQKAAWLPKLASGEVIGTVALGDADGSWDLAAPSLVAEAVGDGFVFRGDKSFVPDAAAADVLLVSARVDGTPAVFLVERAQLAAGALERQSLVDETRRSHRVRLHGVKVPLNARLGGDATKALQGLARLGTLLLSAEMAGGAAGVMDLTLEYLRTRKQFGKLIGGYQALKHPMVEIMLDVERSRSLLYAAATEFDADAPGAEIAVRMSKVQSGETFTHAADRAIQFHGAIGFTYECHAQLYFRRAQGAEYRFGDAAHHRKKLAELIL